MMRSRSSILVLALLGLAHSGLAQCSMCRTAAAAQGAQSSVIDSAILVLLVPALVLFGAIVLLTYRLREQRPEGKSEQV